MRKKKPIMLSWREILGLAFERFMVVRSLKLALLVGTALNLLNQGGALLTGALGEVIWWKFVVTYVIPFLVGSYTGTVARLRYDPGARAPVSTTLECGGCAQRRITVMRDQIVPDCPDCGHHTDWEPVRAGLEKEG